MAKVNLKDALNTSLTKTKAYIDAELDKKANASHGTHLTLGTGSGNAFRGDYGNTAYTHSQAAHAPSNAQKNSDITKAEIEAKLTGTISSHTHAGNTIHYIPKSSFTTTAGNGSSGSYLATKWSVANVNGITAPTDGMIISVRVPAAGVGTAGIVLSINGGTNYYPIVRNVNSLVTTHYAVGATINLVFNSTQTADTYLTSNTKTTVTGCWQIADYDSNSTYTNASLGQGYGTCSTAEATAAKAVTLSSYSLTTGGVVSVKFTYAVPASATMNINSKGAKSVYFRGAAITAGVIKAGDVATFIYNGSQYHLLAIDRWQNDINATIKGLSVSGKTITYTKTDGTTGTITTQDTNTTYSQATSSALGLVKLYTSTGTATDGTMTQSAIKTALDGKADSSHGTHLTLGTTSSTAYRGDYGNTAYTHSQAAHAPSNAQKNSDITKAEIEAKLTGAITTHTHSYLPLSGGTVTGDTTFQKNVTVGNKVTLQYNATSESLDFIFI